MTNTFKQVAKDYGGDIMFGDPQIQVRWVNIEEEGIEWIKEKIEQGMIVVNAPRPIGGLELWEGRFRHGIYYNCGTFEQHGEHWEAYDAWEIRLVSNAEIEAAIKKDGIERVGEERYNKFIKQQTNLPIVYQQMAVNLSMPYYIPEVD